MTMCDQYFDLLSLHRPTKVTELCSSVSKPKGATPPYGIPIWEELPLYAKLPITPSPEGYVVFSRNKIGKKLWKNSKQQDFTLTDPNCYDVSYKYEALHDENLRKFFAQECNLKCIRKLGLITKDGRAICTLKEYNEYRRYLYRVYLNRIYKEVKHRDEIELEKRAIDRATKTEDNYIEMLTKATLRNENSKKAREDIIQERMQKEQKELARCMHYNKCIEQLQRQKVEDKLLRMKKGREFNEKTSKRINNAKIKEQRHKINTMQRWHDSDLTRRKRMAQLRTDMENKKKEKIQNQWDDRIYFQRLRLEYHKSLLLQEEGNMKSQIEIRKRNYELSRIRMEELFHNKRFKRKKGTSYTALLKAIKKIWNDQQPGDPAENEWLVEKTFNDTLAEYHHKADGIGLFAIMQHTKERLEKEVITPQNVSYIVQLLLNNAIQEYVKKNVSLVIISVIEKTIQNRKKSSEEERKRLMFEPTHTRKRSINTYGNGRARSITATDRSRSFLTARRKSSVSSTSRACGVSFGRVSTIDKVEDGKIHRVYSSTRDRPPTPVPSLTDLAEAVFCDKIPMDTSDGSTLEKQKLEKLFQMFSKMMLKNVQSRSTRETVYRTGSQQIGIKMDDVVNKVSEKILNDENFLNDSEEFQLVSDFIYQEIVKQTYAKNKKDMKQKSSTSIKRRTLI